MIFHRKRNLTPSVNLKIDNEVLPEVKKTKFLGVIIDNKLTWKEHITYICCKIRRGIGILLKARNVLYKKTMITLYYSFIYPYFIYCNHVWGCSSAYNLKRLHILQKQAVRIICCAGRNSHSEPLFKECRLLNIWQINKFLIAQFMYKVYHGKLPLLFKEFFERNCNIHQYGTRYSMLFFQILTVKTEYRKSSIRYRGPEIWNYFMQKQVSPSGHICTFKRKLKDFLLNVNN